MSAFNGSLICSTLTLGRLNMHFKLLRWEDFQWTSSSWTNFMNCTRSASQQPNFPCPGSLSSTHQIYLKWNFPMFTPRICSTHATHTYGSKRHPSMIDVLSIVSNSFWTGLHHWNCASTGPWHIAISNGKDQILIEVKFLDLMESRQLNSNYLCDHHGVLDQSTGDSCIRALYSQQLDAALSLCPMEAVR